MGMEEAGIEADPIDGVIVGGGDVGVLENEAVDDRVAGSVEGDRAAGGAECVFFDAVDGEGAGLGAGDVHLLIACGAGVIEIGAEGEADEAFIAAHGAIIEAHDLGGLVGDHIVAPDAAHDVVAEAAAGAIGGGDAGGVIDDVGGVSRGLGEVIGLCEAGGDAFEVVGLSEGGGGGGEGGEDGAGEDEVLTGQGKAAGHGWLLRWDYSSDVSLDARHGYTSVAGVPGGCFRRTGSVSIHARLHS